MKRALEIEEQMKNDLSQAARENDVLRTTLEKKTNSAEK